jgi:hypothetical protein
VQGEVEDAEESRQVVEGSEVVFKRGHYSSEWDNNDIDASVVFTTH